MVHAKGDPLLQVFSSVNFRNSERVNNRWHTVRSWLLRKNNIQNFADTVNRQIRCLKVNIFLGAHESIWGREPGGSLQQLWSWAGGDPRLTHLLPFWFLFLVKKSYKVFVFYFQTFWEAPFTQGNQGRYNDKHAGSLIYNRDQRIFKLRRKGKMSSS
jgi:hypothetical protein